MSGEVNSVTQPQPAPQPTDVRTKAPETRPQPAPRVASGEDSGSSSGTFRDLLQVLPKIPFGHPDRVVEANVR